MPMCKVGSIVDKAACRREIHPDMSAISPRSELAPADEAPSMCQLGYLRSVHDSRGTIPSSLVEVTCFADVMQGITDMSRRRIAANMTRVIAQGDEATDETLKIPRHGGRHGDVDARGGRNRHEMDTVGTPFHGLVMAFMVPLPILPQRRDDLDRVCRPSGNVGVVLGLA